MMVVIGTAGLHASVFPKIPDVILGINQPGPSGIPTDIEQSKSPWRLTDADIALFKGIGVNTIRIPVYPTNIGLDGTKLTWKRGDKFDAAEADKWTVDWSLLDATLDQFQRNGITPYICPHPYPLANWMTIYIPEDADRCLWFTSLIVKHVSAKYGNNVIYGWYENIWKNSMEPWYSGVYRYTLSSMFPAEWHRMLKNMYKGKIKSLNLAWNTHYKSFDEAPVWDLGTIRGIPADAYNNRRTYDLRTAIDLLSRERLLSWRTRLKQIAPGAMWAGACLHDGFDGYYDAQTGNPPACNWGIRTHAITSDVLAADNYQYPQKMLTAYRTIAKIAASEKKSYMAVEINGQSPAAFEAMMSASGSIRGALVWCGKEDAFGLIKTDDSTNKASLDAVKKLFTHLKDRKPEQTRYIPGTVYVYFPEETYRSAVLKSSHLDAYDHVCDTLSPSVFEPVFTSELLKLPGDAPIYVLEKYLPTKAIKAINQLGSRIICPYSYFVDENGRRIERSYVPKDFYADLQKSKYGAELLDAFMRVEEKEFNAAYKDEGAKAFTTSEFKSENEINPGALYNPMDLIDGDPVASRIVFADKLQDEYIDVELPVSKLVYGAFMETAFEDAGRRLANVTIRVSDDGKSWQDVYTTSAIKSDRIHIRFKPMMARFVRFDLGQSTDAIGTRLMEIGVLGR
ncbi:discoidin domain-containing protein [uncultured Desulfobulbus sp.]|uniref:discoidin domain-containing protein n=1 Tax=uncultured Desulfobulbus sp. TaxID=239745 RepID=UPI0029C856FB|nr:discoidin domain-containing protein [uncultured Desulfobulbus sp.]